jgi:hypothetical protein
MSNNLANDSCLLLHQVYAEQLRRHSIELIWMGHKRLNSASYASAEEDDITGMLVQEIKRVIQHPDSPEWVDHYRVHEQVPQNINAQLGKRRPKMDIEFERGGRGPQPRLGFEAKRLGRGNAVGNYLNEEGLGAFLSGYYPTTHGEAGLLGYIQDRTPAEWSAKLTSALHADLKRYQIAPAGTWRPISSNAAAPAACTIHEDSNGKSLFVVHVLLPFT